MSNYKPFQQPGAGKAPGSGPEIPVWLPIVFFLISPPLGIAVFVLRAMVMGKFPPGRGGQALPTASPHPADMPLAGAPQAEASQSSAPAKAAAPKKPASRKKKASASFSAGAMPLAMAIAGAVLILYGIGAASAPVQMLTYGLFSLRSDLWPLLSGIISIGGGCGMLGMAVRMRRLKHLRRNLKNAVGKRDNITLAEICRVLSCNEKTARSIAESAVNLGELGSTAFFDHSSDVLVLRGEAPRPAPAQAESAATQPENPPQSQYQAILQQLRMANDAIPGEEMSEKISRQDL